MWYAPYYGRKPFHVVQGTRIARAFVFCLHDRHHCPFYGLSNGCLYLRNWHMECFENTL